MRNMHVLGVELQDYTVREAMKKTDLYLKKGKVCTIAYITTRGLMAAEHSEELRTFLSNIDLTVAADSDILRAAGVANRNRVREIEDDEFMKEFLKKLVRGRKTVYLLTGTKEQMDVLEKGLRSYQESLRIVGRFSLDTLEQDEDWLINEINGLVPNVIISNISSPQRESFFETNHMKINASIWLMLKDEVVHARYDRNLFWKVGDAVARKLFKRKVVQYLSQDNEENKEDKEEN